MLGAGLVYTLVRYRGIGNTTVPIRTNPFDGWNRIVLGRLALCDSFSGFRALFSSLLREHRKEFAPTRHKQW
jgi:hypothetical protein